MNTLKQLKVNANTNFGCTTLKINDKEGNVYHGRTLEYDTELPSYVTYQPSNTEFCRKAPDNLTDGLSFTALYDMLTVNTSEYEYSDVPIQGFNSAGVSGSLNMKRDSNLSALPTNEYSTAVPWPCLIEWALANCSSVAEIKMKIKTISLWTGDKESIASSFHFAFYDTTGSCLVVEISNNEIHLIDNPTGVMTNGPEFNWHLINLNNYTQMTNHDVNKLTAAGLDLKQPDSGISTALLPSSDTSVGRFVRAVFYSSFAQVEDTPTKAMIELSHIMNKFDRPKNITGIYNGKDYTFEYTVWTCLTDLKNKELYVRIYNSLNYQKFALSDFLKDNKKAAIKIM